MSECVTCKALKSCITFNDFAVSTSNDKLFVSPAANITITCPSGVVITKSLDAGAVGYVLDFELGTPPYPNLILNCTGGTITVPVPDDTTEAQLEALINGMLNTCLNQIATSIGCTGGVFFNTQQSVICANGQPAFPGGAFPPGVSGGVPNQPNLVMSAGIIQSTISVADANAKALQVLNEVFSTGNVKCGT